MRVIFNIIRGLTSKIASLKDSWVISELARSSRCSSLDMNTLYLANPGTAKTLPGAFGD